jgi:hypothetical protein
MVDKIITFLLSGASPWMPTRTATEYDYSNGRTDVIALLQEGTVLALEAKLTRWRDAIQQAYRNTCFAHESLVVLPWGAAERASAFRAEFERRKIGLCGVQQDGVFMLIEPAHVEPLLPQLTARALMKLDAAVAA